MPRHVLHLLYEPRRSGISRHVASIVRGLPDLRHVVVIPAGLAGSGGELIALGAEVTVVPIGSRVLPRAAFAALPRRIRAARPDVVHLHNVHTGLFGSLAARLAGDAPVVFTPQVLELRRRALEPLYRALLRVAGRRHAAWVAVSREQAAAFARLVPPERVHWVPNAAPPVGGDPPPRDEARRRLGLPPAATVALGVGRLVSQKDPATFARAAARLSAVEWVLAGDGPLRPELAAAARAAPNLHLLGHVDPVDDAYAAADVVCLSSRWEGLPYAVLEAMARGLPVVASDVPGTRELVRPGETGDRFAPGDDAALAAAVRALADDPARRARLGAGGRALVAADYSEAAAGARLRGVYEVVLGAAR